MKYVKLAVKIALVVGLLYFLARKGLLSFDATKAAFGNWQVLCLSFFGLFLTSFLSVIRWRWLLEAQGIRLSMMRVFQLQYVGNFFNIALPGAVSGDFVKAFYISKEIEGLRARAFGSILFDRVVGVSALILVSAGAMILDFRQLAGGALIQGIKVMVLVTGLGFLAFYAYLFLVKEKHDPLLMAFKWAEKKHKVFGSLSRIYEGIRHYHKYRWVIVKSLLLSIAIHCTVCLSSLGFAHAIGDMALDPWQVFVIVPMGLLVTAIPIFPAGVGTGHVAFGWLFHFLGTNHGADIFSLFAMSQFMIGGFGGLVYLRFKSTAEPASAPRGGRIGKPKHA